MKIENRQTNPNSYPAVVCSKAAKTMTEILNGQGKTNTSQAVVQNEKKANQQKSTATRSN